MTGRIRFRPRVFELVPAPRAAELMGVLHSSAGGAWLDSSGGSPARFSLCAFEPIDPELSPLPQELAGLAPALGRIERVAIDDLPGPFAGGFIGAFAYDLGIAGEAQRLPPDPWGGPLVVGGFYCDFVVLDHEAARAWLVLGEEPGDARASVAARRERFHANLCTPVALARATPLGPLVRHVSDEEHMARIERLQAEIASGELYQANLAHRFTRAMRGHPLAIYRELRARHPAPYQLYIAWGSDPRRPDGALLSASPELLLESDGQRLRTRPIKGTIARGATVAEDARASAALLASEKDRAELAMIVDLERNDLGRVARVGSVRVGSFPMLESYATVHHLVAQVEGELASGRTALDALAALFPGGSVTGAPKLAAMRAIARLEGAGRGFFTGSAGCADLAGKTRFNILIRTLVWRPGGQPDTGDVSFHVGGGITWSSDPSAELQETLHKCRALERALEGGAVAAEDPILPTLPTGAWPGARR